MNNVVLENQLIIFTTRSHFPNSLHSFYISLTEVSQVMWRFCNECEKSQKYVTHLHIFHRTFSFLKVVSFHKLFCSEIIHIYTASQCWHCKRMPLIIAHNPFYPSEKLIGQTFLLLLWQQPLNIFIHTMPWNTRFNSLPCWKNHELYNFYIMQVFLKSRSYFLAYFALKILNICNGIVL